MAELTLDKVPERVRDYYKKGLAASQKGNLDYAIDMMSSALELEPSLLAARKVLREAEIRKLQRGKITALTHVVSSAGGVSQYLKGLALLKAGKALQALSVAETLLKRDALNLKFVNFFADAAKAAGMPEAAAHTLEMARGFHPADPELLRMLGQIYLDTGQMRSARETFERLCELQPNDFRAKKALKDATALASIMHDGWQEAADKGGTYREMIKNSEEAAVLDKESKAVKTDRDADVLVKDALARIEKEPENINYHRALSRLYLQLRRFDEAIGVLERALEISSGDPEVHANLTAARIQKMDAEIAALRESGREQDAAAREADKKRFISEDLAARIKRYPNDLSIRFDMGVLLFNDGLINEAIQQFQTSQRSPKHRIESLYRLAVCFKNKRQYDLALRQLEVAESELPVMDDTRKMILYELGTVCELLGNREKALQWFKQIYQSDIGYRDVAGKVEHAYN